jgi:hypothetical protein
MMFAIIECKNSTMEYYPEPFVVERGSDGRPSLGAQRGTALMNGSKLFMLRDTCSCGYQNVASINVRC